MQIGLLKSRESPCLRARAAFRDWMSERFRIDVPIQELIVS